MKPLSDSVCFVWDEFSGRWVIKGDPKKLCKWVSAFDQICRKKGETYGHTCLVPSPESKNCWEPRSEVKAV